MFNKIKAVKNLRDEAKKVQSSLEEVKAVGEAAWGKVKVVINGNQKVLDVHVDDELLKDKAKLEAAIRDAFDDAFKKMQKQLAGRMKDMDGLKEMMKNLGM